MAWLLCGDFNEVLFAHEKKGGNPSDFSSIHGFREVLDKYNLRDVCFTGYPFTWSNRRREGFIEERLDRAVANPVWHDIFRDVVVDSIIWDSSDHYPLCLCFGGFPSASTRRSLPFKKIFRFEAKWCQVDSFEGILSDFWGSASGSDLSSSTKKVKHCGKLLIKWDKETFKRTQWRIA